MTSSTSATLLCVIVALALSGASATRAAVPTSAPATAREPRIIAVLGDASRTELASQLAAAARSTPDLQIVTAEGDGAAKHLKLAAQADVVLIAVNATDGPMPITREHVLLTRQMRAPEVIIAFTNTQRIDDLELLELEELEVRELLNTYGLPGDTVPCMFDNPKVPTRADFKAAKGAAAMVKTLSDSAARRPTKRAEAAGDDPQPTRALVYVLAPQETFARNVAAPLTTGPASLNFGEHQYDVEVRADSPIEPAGNDEVTVTFKQSPPPAVAIGDRFVILRNDHIAAVGTLIPANPAAAKE